DGNEVRWWAFASGRRAEFPAPSIELIAMKPMPQRDHARHRTRCHALRDDRQFLIGAPAAPPRRPGQHLHSTETVPINWQTTCTTIHCCLPLREAESSETQWTVQGGSYAPLTLEEVLDQVVLDVRIPRLRVVALRPQVLGNVSAAQLQADEMVDLD